MSYERGRVSAGGRINGSYSDYHFLGSLEGETRVFEKVNEDNSFDLISNK